MKLVALDLDGTLTQHRSKLEAETQMILNELLKTHKLLMVCAGGCQRVFSQMEEFPVDIIGFYGMESSVIENKKLRIIDRIKTVNDKAQIVRKVEQLRDELDFVDYFGESVEFHDSGIITFPLIGTTAPLNKKLEFDPKRLIRRKCYGRVCEVFNEYNVFVGGSSSFDIAPKPYRKLYALEQYLNKLNIRKSEVIYFGDDYGLGGNDSDIYNSDIRFVTIDDYRDFPRIAKDVLL